MNLIAARRIIAVNKDRGIGQLSEITGSPRMIENHFLIKLFQVRAHEKNRPAS